MKGLHVITPVKDSIESTLNTIHAVLESDLSIPCEYTVYNDFSTPENTAILQRTSKEKGFGLVNLSDLTSHPSPNYLLVLQMAQRKAAEADAALCIVESDVTVAKDTLQGLYDISRHLPQCGMVAAVTADAEGNVNYPYLYAKNYPHGVVEVVKHCSFCCTLLTPALLRAFPFTELDAEKSWFDVTVSHESRKRGFRNYLFTALPVVHRPHQSRPWKQLKYKSPLVYYWKKYTKGLDKI